MGESRRARELTRAVGHTALAAALWLVAAGATAQPPCIGDCDGDARIGIDDLVAGIGAILSPDPPACVEWDPDGDGRVLITDLVRGVGLALDGACTPAPARLDDILALVRPLWAAACSAFGPPTSLSSRASAGEVILSCDGIASPGHSSSVSLIRYHRGDAPYAYQYFSPASGFTDATLRDLPARYQVTPFMPGTLDGAERRLVWRLDCWVAIVSSFDDTHFRYAPDVVSTSEAILDAAEPAMRAACDER